MTMDLKEFKENILLHGVDLCRWPEEIKDAGVELLQKSSEMRAFVAEQEKFERLLKTRKYEEPSDNLAQRILEASLQQEKKGFSGIGLLLSGLFTDEFRLAKPALILISILMIVTLGIGFFIGFLNSTGSMLTDQKQATLQEFLHCEEDVL